MKIIISSESVVFFKRSGTLLLAFMCADKIADSHSTLIAHNGWIIEYILDLYGRSGMEKTP